MSTYYILYILSFTLFGMTDLTNAEIKLRNLAKKKPKKPIFLVVKTGNVSVLKRLG